MIHAMHDQIMPQPEMMILCCQCGVAIKSNPINTCVDCLQNRYDIGAGVAKQVQQHTCRGCNRFERRDGGWTAVEMESKELLALLLKKPRGLAAVRLVDASFVWTEPHSKRIKLRVTIQKEIITNAVLQQSFVIEYVIGNKQCPHCQRREAKDTWVAMLQVRQKVPHKRTFLWMEQLILRHAAHVDATNILEVKDGLDFFFDQRSHAEKLMSFLQGVAPTRYKTSKSDLSIDTQTGKCKTKFTYALEILPICKDDVVWLPRTTAHHLGQFAQLAICSKVSNVVHLLDHTTITNVEMQPHTFWKDPFKASLSKSDLTEFVVLDVEMRDPEWATRGRRRGARSGREARALADVTVARRSDFGINDRRYTCVTHLGNLLKSGDYVWGYAVAASPLATDLDEHEARQLPEVLLIKKSYSDRRHRERKKKRVWKLKTLEKDKDPGVQRGRHMDVSQQEADYEDFLQELEEDPEMRKQINLYKDHEALEEMEMERAARQMEVSAARVGRAIGTVSANSVFAAPSQAAAAAAAAAGSSSSSAGVPAAVTPPAMLPAMLPAMRLPNGLEDDEEGDGEGGEDEEDDFPDVGLEELLDELTLGAGEPDGEGGEDEDEDGEGGAARSRTREIGPVMLAAPQPAIELGGPSVEQFQLPEGSEVKFCF